MNANDAFFARDAHVDDAAVQPLPNARKVYIQGSRPDVRVPIREIAQSDTPASFGLEKNPPIEERPDPLKHRLSDSQERRRRS